MSKQLFLISSSKSKGRGYLEHVRPALREFIGSLNHDEYVLFIPYALKDFDGYTQVARKAFLEMGYNLISHHESSTKYTSSKIRAIFVGGGNTFRLLETLHVMLHRQRFNDIRNLVLNDGVKYIGSSAGSNMACPTIKTTNDMPIVDLPNFNALHLVDFQINPHFVPGSLVPGHMGETRETRIKEFHEENTTLVIGLTETNWITVDGEKTTLHGESDSFIFERGKEQRLWHPETVLEL